MVTFCVVPVKALPEQVILCSCMVAFDAYATWIVTCGNVETRK